jgi:hypothetical protein
LPLVADTQQHVVDRNVAGLVAEVGVPNHRHARDRALAARDLNRHVADVRSDARALEAAGVLPRQIQNLEAVLLRESPRLVRMNHLRGARDDRAVLRIVVGHLRGRAGAKQFLKERGHLGLLRDQRAAPPPGDKESDQAR